ncbi:hypothetical protein Peur_017174 [Populus x canadensis]
MVSMGKASCDGRFIRALSPTLKARVRKGSIVIFKRIRFSLKAKAFVFRKKSSFTYRVMHVYAGGGEKIYDVLPADSTFLFFLCFRCVFPMFFHENGGTHIKLSQKHVGFCHDGLSDSFSACRVQFLWIWTSWRCPMVP